MFSLGLIPKGNFPKVFLDFFKKICHRFFWKPGKMKANIVFANLTANAIPGIPGFRAMDQNHFGQSNCKILEQVDTIILCVRSQACPKYQKSEFCISLWYLQKNVG